MPNRQFDATITFRSSFMCRLPNLYIVTCLSALQHNMLRDVPCAQHVFLLVNRKLASATRAVSILSPAALASTKSVSADTDPVDGGEDEYAIEASLLPARIRTRYLETLVEWVVQAISKSSSKDKGEAGFHKEIEAWELVSTLLQMQAPAPAVVLSEGLLPAMVVVLSDPATTGARPSRLRSEKLSSLSSRLRSLELLSLG